MLFLGQNRSTNILYAGSQSVKINIAHKRISNISITHQRIITQKRINKAFRIWQESCSRTTWKALTCH